MTGDPTRVRVLGVRGFSDGTEHIDRGCPCASWATHWKDWLLAALPASARGRIDVDVEIAHPGPAGQQGSSAAPSVDAGRIGPGQGWAGLPVVAAGSAIPADGGPAGPAAATGDLLVVQDTDELSRLAALLSDGDDGARTAACDHVVAAIEHFEPDVVLGYGTGSVLAYEALAQTARRVPLLISVSSPLAIPWLFSALRPAPVHAQGQWPGSTEHWIDIYDRRDPLAARRPLIDHFDGPVADRPVDLAQPAGSPEQAYLSCHTLGAVLEDCFGRRRADPNLIADLRRVLSDICADQIAIYTLLSDIDFPMARLEADFRGAEHTWAAVLHELSCGVLNRGVDVLLEQARLRFPDNPELSRVRRYCNRPAARY